MFKKCLLSCVFSNDKNEIRVESKAKFCINAQNALIIGPDAEGKFKIALITQSNGLLRFIHHKLFTSMLL